MLKVIRLFFWLICLALSIAASIFFYAALSREIYYQRIIPIAVITIEFIAQMILSSGKEDWKARLYFPAAVKMGLYSVYILFFGVLSCMSFFVSHVAGNEKMIDRIEYQEDRTRGQIEANEQLLQSLGKALDKEVETTYRSNSKAIMANIDRIKAEQKDLESQLNDQPAAKKINDTFRDMAAMIKIVSANTLKVASFGVLTLLIFAGLIILNPSFKIKEKTKTDTKDATSSVTRNAVKKPVTLRKAVTNVTGELCICGCGKPRTGNSMYAEEKCRVTYFRAKKREAAMTAKEGVGVG